MMLGNYRTHRRGKGIYTSEREPASRSSFAQKQLSDQSMNQNSENPENQIIADRGDDWE